MRKLFPIALLFIFCVSVCAQNTTTTGWTDKNNGEMYAAYMLRVTYYERGYMAANVTVNRNDGRDVYVVEPGPVYHFNDVSITGLPETDIKNVMQDAPQAGEVCSAAHVNECVAQVKKRFQLEGRNVKVMYQMQLDHAAATANVSVTFE